MSKNRLEAFSDGVLAIILTIMVLEMKIPHSAAWADLKKLMPVFISYALSFIFIGIYWGNHHHLLHTVKRVSGGVMWANMNLLFWLSLVPFTTGWMGENNFAQNTVIAYAVVLMLCGAAFSILQKAIRDCHQKDVHMAKVHAAQRRKGIISVTIYALAIVCAFFDARISGVLFFVVAGMWLIPDKNIERAIEEHHH